MNSKILSKIGMGNIDPGIWVIISIVAILIAIVLIVINVQSGKKLKKMEERLAKLCRGKSAESLEDELAKLFEDNDYLISSVEDHKFKIRNIYKRLEKNYQKMALIKYDAFHQMGGQLSFVLALLDENDNGFLINSVHSANSSYCYSKEIINGESNIELGDEEYAALEQAKAVELHTLK